MKPSAPSWRHRFGLDRDFRDRREMVERSGVGFLADPCDADVIARRLDQLLRLWRDQRLPSGRASWVANYERRRLTEDLVEFVDAIVGR